MVENFLGSLKTMAKNKCSSTTFDITLSDAKFRNVFEATVSNISADSRFALYNYAYPTPPTPSQLGFEIFDVSGDKLTTVASLPASDGTFTGLSAVGNHQLTQLVLFDENVNTVGPNALTTVRLRLATFNGSTITISNTTKTFPSLPSALVDGGAYSALYTSDGTGIVFWFLGPKFNLNFTLLSATDLHTIIPPQIVVAAQATKSPVTNGPTAFRLCNANGTATDYLSLASGFGKSSPGQPVVNSNLPPATLKIFRIDPNAFTQVAQAEQSQYPNTAFAFDPINCCQQSTNILVSERASYLPGQPSIFMDVSKTSSFNGQTENLRVYSFDGTSLNQIAGHAFDTTVLLTNWYPDGQTFGVVSSSGAQNNVTNDEVQTMTFYRLCKNRGCNSGTGIEPLNFFVTVPPEAFFSQFTPDGRHLLVGGSPIVGVNGKQAINNVLLFDINSNLPAFECPNNNNNHCHKKCPKRCH